MSSIEDFQLKLLRNLKDFLYKNNLNSFYKASLDYFYLCPYSSNKGKSKLFSYFDMLTALKLYIISSIKDVYKVSKIYNFHTQINYKKYDYETILVNWASIKDFDKNGNYNDKHFNVKSNTNDKILWYLIYTDDVKPKKLGKNIRLVIQKKKFFTINSFARIFLNLLKERVLHYLNQSISYSHILSLYVYSDIENFVSKKTKHIIMPYEGQPFQNSIFLKIEKIDRSIKRIGYVHSFPSGVPSNFLKRNGSPEYLIVNGISQKECFTNNLGWKKKEINVLPSSRFRKEKNFIKKNDICLPINFENEKLILNSLIFLIKKKMIDIKKLKIKNHPFSSNSKKHKKLIQNIKELQKKEKN